MITIGGYDESLRSPDRYWRDPDPWSNGLGVFDLTEMRWSNEYNAAAEGYKSPAVVKTWYSEGGLESVAWSDNTLKRMFLEPQSTTIPPDQESSTPSDPGTDTSPSPSLEIVLGAVLGGVGGGTLLAAAAFLFYRHHRKEKAKTTALELTNRDNSDKALHKQMVESLAQELPSWSSAAELPTDHNHCELGAAHGHTELPCSDTQCESQQPREQSAR